MVVKYLGVVAELPLLPKSFVDRVYQDGDGVSTPSVAIARIRRLYSLPKASRYALSMGPFQVTTSEKRRGISTRSGS